MAVEISLWSAAKQELPSGYIFGSQLIFTSTILYDFIRTLRTTML